MNPVFFRSLRSFSKLVMTAETARWDFLAFCKNARRTWILKKMLRGILFSLTLLIAALLVNGAVIMAVEGWSAWQTIWFTCTTITTVGYGDISPSTVVTQWSTIVTLFFFGIIMFTYIIAKVSGVIAMSREQMNSGQYLHHREKHIVFAGWNEAYLKGVITELRSSIHPFSKADIIIVSPLIEELPLWFRERGVLHVSREFYEVMALEAACIEHAAHVVIIPENGDDFRSIDLVERIREIRFDMPITAEVYEDSMAKFLEGLGCDTQSHNPSYPAMLVREIIAPRSGDMVSQVLCGEDVQVIAMRSICTSPINMDYISERLSPGMSIFGSYDARTGTHHVGATQLLLSEGDIVLIAMDLRKLRTRGQHAPLNLQEQLPELTALPVPRRIGLIGSSARMNDEYMEELQAVMPGTEFSILCTDCWVGDSLTAEELVGIDAVIILADDPLNGDSDAKTSLTINYLRNQLGFAADAQGDAGRIIAEAVLPENRERFQRYGATDVLRPVTEDLEILALCIRTRAEELLDNLFDSAGHELLRFTMTTVANWGDVQKAASVLGLPMGVHRYSGVMAFPPETIQLNVGDHVFIWVDTSKHGVDHARLQNWFATLLANEGGHLQ